MNKENSRLKIIVYIVIRVLVVGVMIAQILNHNWHNVMTCVLTLVLLMMPTFIERKLSVNLPTALEIIVVLFIFAAEILGEIHGFYVIFPKWDDMLHTTNGFIAAAVGFALVDLLNRHENVKLNLSPGFVAGTAFCFSMTIGVLWEFFECFMDMFFGMDMQKDTWIDRFNSVALNPDGLNLPVHVYVEGVSINGGEVWSHYLDIGLYDTMHDLFVNLIGAVVFSLLGLIYIKNRGKGIAAEFIPIVEEEEDIK